MTETSNPRVNINRFIDDEIVDRLKICFQRRTSFLILKSKEDRARYDGFARRQGSAISLCIVFFIFSALGIYILALSPYYNDAHSHESTELGILSVICLIFGIVLVLFAIGIMTTKFYEHSFMKGVAPYLGIFQNSYMLLFTVLVGILLYLRSAVTLCDTPGQDSFLVSDCNPEAASQALPQAWVIFYLLAPLVFSCIFRKVKFKLLCLSWLITVSVTLFCILYREDYFSLSALVVYIPLSVVIICDIQRQYLSAYFLTEEMVTLVEVARAQSETYSEEFRGLMGNMSHDLKTVSIHIHIYTIIRILTYVRYK